MQIAKKVLAILLAMLMVFSTFAVGGAGLALTASAAETGKAIRFVSNGAADFITGAQTSNVWFGNYKQSGNKTDGWSVDPIKWRVLSNADGKLFLLSDQNLDACVYYERYFTATWETSTIRAWLNGTGEFGEENFKDSAFSSGEDAAVCVTNVSNPDSVFDDRTVPGGSDTADKVFLLSRDEAMNTAYGFTNDIEPTDTRVSINTAYTGSGGSNYGWTSAGGSADYWWLRSPGSADDRAAIVFETGQLNPGGYDVPNRSIAVRPAVNVDLGKVLFTSAAENGKQGDGLTAVGTYTGADWKLTLLDDSRSFAVTANASSVGSGSVTNGYNTGSVTNGTDAQPQTAVKAQPGNNVTLTYSGASVGENEYISAILTDETGAALYYGRLAQPTAADGTVTVTIPADLASGEYTLKLFSEQYNGDKMTDYASAPVDVTLTVTGLFTGKGTKDAPYEIASDKDWQTLSQFVADGGETEGLFFRQTADVNASTYVGTEANPFAGTYDGGGKTLTASLYENVYFLAPFSYITGATIENLRVEGTVSGGLHSAGLVGAIAGTGNLIRNCVVAAEIWTNESYCGGFVGHGGSSETTIEGCVFTGSIIAGSNCNAGVFWGRSENGAKVTIRNCLENGAVYLDFNFNPVGMGFAAEKVIDNVGYRTAQNGSPNRNWDNAGKRLYRIERGENVSLVFGEAKTFYDVSGLGVYDSGLMLCGDKAFAPADNTVALTASYTGEVPAGYVATFSASAGTLANGTLTMPAQDMTISASVVYNGKAILLTENGKVPDLAGAQTSSVWFGNYMQSSADSKEPVKWRVLSNADSKLFLLADQNLDVFEYNKENTSVTWETCDMRSWLNGYDTQANQSNNDNTDGSFKGRAFSEKEAAAVAETTVVNDNNPIVNTSGGSNTTDKVFLLSIDEARNADYGFTDNYDPTDTRIATNTAYTASGGEIGVVGMGGVDTACYWWLRSPGFIAELACIVSCDGSLDYAGVNLNNLYIAVRPALNIDLGKVLFTSPAEGGKEGDGLTAVGNYTGSDWKLTVLDAERSGFTASGDSRTGDVWTVKYSGAKTGDNEYISAVIVDGDGAVTYYGRLCKAESGDNNTITVDVSGKMNDGDKLYVFNEQYNGDKKTDYASAPVDVALNVKEKEATTVTIDPIDPVFFSYDAEIKLSVTPADAEGDLVVYVDGETFETTTDELTLTIPTLANVDDLDDPQNIHAGSYVVRAEFKENDEYKGSETAQLLTVAKNKVDIAIGCERVYIENVIDEFDLTFYTTVCGDRLSNVAHHDLLTGECIVQVDEVETYYRLDSDWGRYHVFSGLPIGEHCVIVRYPGDRDHEAAVSSETFKMNPVVGWNGISVAVPDTGVEEHAQATVLIFDEFHLDTAALTVKNSAGETVREIAAPVSDYTGGDPSVQAVATADLGALDAGRYTLETRVDRQEEGSNGGLAYTATTAFRVLHKDAAITITAPQDLTAGKDADFGLALTPAGATGEISVFADGTRYTAAADASFVTIPGLSAGTHEIRAYYAGDDGFVPAEAQVTVTVSKAEPTLQLDHQASYAESAEPAIVVTLTNAVDPTGDVTVMIDNEPYTGTIVDGNACVTIPAKAAGKYVISAYYKGDQNNEAAFASGEYTVTASRGTSRSRALAKRNGAANAKAETPAAPVFRIKPIESVTYGEDVTIELELLSEGVTGKIVVTVGGRTYETDTDHLTLTVPTEVDLEAKDTLKPGMKDYFDHFYMPGIPDIDPITTESYGKKTHAFWVPYDPYTSNDNLNAGAYLVTAAYEGDEAYAPAKAYEVLTVNKKKAELDVEIARIGGGVDIGITILTPSTDNAINTLINGKAYPVNEEKHVFAESFLPGQYMLTVHYIASRNDDETILFVPFENTAPGLRVDAPDVRSGDRAAITVSVSDADLVDFDADRLKTVDLDVKDSSGETVYSKTDLTPVLNTNTGLWTVTDEAEPLEMGTYTVEATLRIESEFNEYKAATTLRVLKKEAALTITAPDGVTAGGDAPITVALTPAQATGDVTVYVDGAPNTPDADGKVTVSGITAGSHTVRAVYAGDDVYDAAEATGTFTAGKAQTSVSVTAENASVIAGTTQTITFSVSPAVTTDDLTVMINNVQYGVPIQNGKGEIESPALPAGKCVVAAFLPEDDANTAAFDVFSFDVESDPDQDAADAVMEKIGAIGEVEYTDESKQKIDDAREAYDDLTDAQKDLVTNYTTLTDAETKYALLEARAWCAQNGHKYVYESNNNGTHNVSCEVCDYAQANVNCDYDETVHPANCTSGQYSTFTCPKCHYSYDGPQQGDPEHTFGDEGEARYTCTQCGEVDEARKAQALADDMAEFDAYKQAQKKAADERTLDGDSDEAAALIENAKKAIDAVTYDETKSLDDNKKAVDDAADLAGLEKALTDQRAADAVKEKIDAIGEVELTDESRQKIDDAKTAYDALTDDQKALVDNLDDLTAAEEAYHLLEDVAAFEQYKETLKQAAEDKRQDGDGDECKQLIDDAIAAINDVEYDETKPLQDNKDALDDAVDFDQLDKDLADQRAADAVEDMIDAIGDVELTDECKDKIDDAREAYDALTDEQKDLVDNADDLTAAEEEYERLDNKAQFEDYKDELIRQLEDKRQDDDSDETSKLIDDAIDAINDVEYDETKPLEDNKDALDDAVDLDQLDADLTEHREIHYAEFYADGTLVESVPYTIDTKSITEPAVPDKPGHTGAWPDYTLKVGGTRIDAVYTPNPQTVNFDPNGGEGEMESVTTAWGSTITLPECTFTAPNGKEFDKWDAGDPGDEVTITGDLTVTAVWKEKPLTLTVDVDPTQTGERIKITVPYARRGGIAATLTASEEGVRYESSKPGVISVDDNGVIRLEKLCLFCKTATITAYSASGEKVATCVVNVKHAWWQYIIWLLLGSFWF